MLDLRYIEEHEAEVRAMLAARRVEFDLDAVLALSKKRRDLIGAVEGRRAEQNRANEDIARAKKAGEDAAAAIAAMKQLADEAKRWGEELTGVEEELKGALLFIPNMPHTSVPAGASEADNQERRRWGEPRRFDFAPRPHWEIGEMLGMLDAERAVKIAGARFVATRGAGARLERALQNLMLDEARARGYTEINVPFIVTGDAMKGTAQLPKFEEDLYRITDPEGIQITEREINEYYDRIRYLIDKDKIRATDELGRLLEEAAKIMILTAGGQYLIPTAEVPVTNLHAGEILAAEDLPIKYAAFTACFRREAGAPGRDTRGMMRVHQFLKVELVKLVAAETSYDEHESLIRDAAHILELLELPYREVVLCTADLGFGAAKCVDLEVWLPSEDNYREISSCSNYEAFQARRMNTRYRPAAGAKPAFVHTLNGSALAVGRTLIAILENYQNADGSVTIPKALVPYMDGQEKIT